MTSARPPAARATVSLILALLSIGILGTGSALIGNTWSTPLPANNGFIMVNNAMYDNSDIQANAFLNTVIGWTVIICLTVLCLAVATRLRGNGASRAMWYSGIAIFGLGTGLWLIVHNGWRLQLPVLALILCYVVFVWWFVLRESPAPGRAQAAAPHPPELAAVAVHATVPEEEGTRR